MPDNYPKPPKINPPVGWKTKTYPPVIGGPTLSPTAVTQYTGPRYTGGMSKTTDLFGPGKIKGVGALVNKMVKGIKAYKAGKQVYNRGGIISSQHD
jgi:hypothetical protein